MEVGAQGGLWSHNGTGRSRAPGTGTMTQDIWVCGGLEGPACLLGQVSEQATGMAYALS